MLNRRVSPDESWEFRPIIKKERNIAALKIFDTRMAIYLNDFKFHNHDIPPFPSFISETGITFLNYIVI